MGLRRTRKKSTTDTTAILLLPPWHILKAHKKTIKKLKKGRSRPIVNTRQTLFIENSNEPALFLPGTKESRS